MSNSKKTGVFLVLSACLFLSCSKPEAPLKKTIKILCYDSFLSDDGLIPIIKTEAQKICPESTCEIVWEGTKDLAGLLGKLAQEKRKGTLEEWDLVVGINQAQYRAALHENYINPGHLFDQSPFTVLVDTKKFKGKNLPKSWLELAQKNPQSLLIQDPRLSNVGIGWLRSIFEYKLISKDDAAKLAKRIFPSWSSSYDAFMQEEAPFVWTLLTSEAYHRCNGKTDEEKSRYQSLQLEEGYPVEEEFVATIKKTKPKPEAAEVAALLVSPLIQKEIALKNWMYPGISVELPECYKELPQVKTLPASQDYDQKTLQGWLDTWSL